MVKGFEPTGQGPSNAGLVGMPVRSLLVEQAATDPEELEVEVEELDVEVVEVEDDDVDDVEDDDVVEVELDDVDDVELHQPDVDVDVVLEDDVELVDVHHCAQPDDTMMTVKNNDATAQIKNFRTDFLSIDKSPLLLMFARKLKTTIANAIFSVILRW